MSKLMDLAQSDPDALKAKASDIADALKEKAETATGDEKTALTKMADKFSTLAETGDMSALKPDGPPPSKAASAYAKNSGTSDDTMGEIMSIVSSKLS